MQLFRCRKYPRYLLEFNSYKLIQKIGRYHDDEFVFIKPFSHSQEGEPIYKINNSFKGVWVLAGEFFFEGERSLNFKLISNLERALNNTKEK